MCLGTGLLSLPTRRSSDLGASGIITAAGLQLMGAGSAHLDNSANHITTLAASFNGAISYTDASALTVGTVSDGFSGMSTSEIGRASRREKVKIGRELVINQEKTVRSGNL